MPAVVDRRGEMIKAARIKLIVIEGSLELSLNRAPDKVLKLFAGDMVAFSEDAEELPQKFKIDIDQLTRTSLLINGGLGQLPDLQLIDAEIVTQNGEKRGGELLASDNADTHRRRFLSRFLPGNVISHARDVLKGRAVASGAERPPAEGATARKQQPAHTSSSRRAARGHPFCQHAPIGSLQAAPRTKPKTEPPPTRET